MFSIQSIFTFSVIVASSAAAIASPYTPFRCVGTTESGVRLRVEGAANEDTGDILGTVSVHVGDDLVLNDDSENGHYDSFMDMLTFAGADASGNSIKLLAYGPGQDLNELEVRVNDVNSAGAPLAALKESIQCQYGADALAEAE